MHYHYIIDADGNIIDQIPFCCDAYHRDYCDANGLDYGGWNGAHEGGDFPDWCANCGTYAGGTPECDCQQNNVVVNRIPSEKGIKCEHDNYLQVPIRWVNFSYGE